MCTLSDIFKALPPTGEVAIELGITEQAVRAWRLKDRRAIPGNHWPAIVRIGRERGIPLLTYENLEAAHKPARAG